MPQCRQDRREKKYCIFTTWPCPSTRTPAPWVMKCTILLDLSLFIVYLLYTQFVLSMPGYTEENSLKNNAFSLHDLIYGHAFAQEPQARGS